MHGTGYRSGSDQAIGDRIADELERRRIELAVAERLRLIDDVYGLDRADGTVLRFERTLPVGDEWRTYTYVALRASGRWYLSGPRSRNRDGQTWDELRAWLAADERPPRELVTLVPAPSPSADWRVQTAAHPIITPMSESAKIATVHTDETPRRPG